MLRTRPARTLSLLTLPLLASLACPLMMNAQQKPAQVLIERARMLDAQGRYDLALENWRQVLLLDPHQPDGLAALAAYYRSTGDQARAQSYQRLLNAVRPGAAGPAQAPATASNSKRDTRLDQAARLAAAHQYAASLAAFREVFGTTPPDNWAIAYYQTEAAVPAESAHGIAGLRALMAKYPANPAYQLALAKVLTYGPATRLEGARMLSAFQGSASQNEEARKAWRAAILWDAGSPAALETSRLYLERYPDQELSAHLQSAAPRAAAPASPAEPLVSPAEGAGYRALAAGDLSEAAARFQSMTAQPLYAARGEAGLGYVSMKNQDFPAAVGHFESARAKGMKSAALDKALHEARYFGAMATGNQALQAKDPAAAAAAFARARELDARRPEAAEALGGSMLAEQDPQQAEQVFAADVKNNPGRPDAWLGWMNALLEAGKPDVLLAMQPKIPPAVRAQLAHRPDYLAMLLCAERAQGNAADSRMLLDRIAKADPGTGTDDAGVRAARLLFRYSYFNDASRLCVAALKRDNNNADAWQILVQSEHMAGRDRSAIALAGRMPHTVDAVAMSNPGFLMALASIYQGDGQLANAKALLDRAQKLAGGDHAGPSGVQMTGLQMQRASLALAQGDAPGAYRIYQGVTESAPDNLDAWTGMFSALHADNRDAEALAAMHDLPDGVSGRLRHDATFLETAAYVYSGTGHSREAMLCLRAVTDHYMQQHQPVPFGASIELAWLQLNAGDQRPLAATLDRLGKQPTLTLAQTVALRQVWVAWSLRRAEAAFASGDSKQAIDILEVAAQAYPGDTNLKTQLAGMYVRTGHSAQGMKLYEGMNWEHASVDQFTSGIGAALTAHTMSYAEYWLQLGLQQYPGNPALLRAGAHVEESKGNLKAAESYLRLAIGHTPPRPATSPSAASQGADDSSAANAAGSGDEALDASPESQLAHLLGSSDGPSDRIEPVTSRTQSRAGRVAPSESSEPPVSLEPLLDAQPQFSHAHAQQEDFPLNEGDEHGAVLGDASGTIANYARPATLHSSAGYRSPGRTSLPEITPDQPGLVRVASSRKTRAHPLTDDALPAIPSAKPAPNPSNAGDGREEIADPLHGLDLGLDATPRDLNGSAQSNTTGAPQSLSELLDSAQAEQAAPSAAAETPANTLEAELLGNGAPRPEPMAGVTRVADPSKAAMVRRPVLTAADELGDLQARYSPWLAAGGDVETHSGTTGFDHLEHYEAEAAASTTLGAGAARLSIITRPVLLQSGVPDTTSNYRFGSSATLPTDTQFASGTGGTLQLATRNFQASVGFSPSGFLIDNVLGSVTYRPRSGPFTFNGYRTSQKDSLLSYAGIKDPSTGEVWGGVVATGGSLQYAHGAAMSGYYASIDGQKLTGQNVTDNTRIMGNAGAYWLAYSNPYGELKVGANFTAMHYALNERYFTIGQGGYFSPDAFLLMNAPVSWTGRPIQGTSYVISGSLGAQSIQQDAAMPGSLVLGTGVETTTGSSYALHIGVAHRMDLHWTVEGFFDTNNARQYTDNSAGFTVRYSQYPRSVESAPTGFMDLGQQLPLETP